MKALTQRLVVDFFAERGLVPVVIAQGGGSKLHAAVPELPQRALCPKLIKRDRAMRPAEGDELLWRQCRGCVGQRLVQVSRAPLLNELRETRH